ncbi:unnamed protein product [Brassica rapa subsp. narinosa]|uniref:(rape) hypothetical protein n=1 Tax=Brassica napus TaxID=3708 RepID=A0A816TE02_BRANA|nr:unnamed protein product [Brassica napus]
MEPAVPPTLDRNLCFCVSSVVTGLNFCLSVEIARICWSTSSSSVAPGRKPGASVDACSEPLR